jgi:hypothetical protein
MNNFAQLSENDSTKFLVRWRGRQEGPYLASVIEAKLAANEIGLLHEIFHNGQWVTIRDYITEREAIIRAELQAREEQERRAREEAERQAKAKEEIRRQELLAEERRRSEQIESVKARQMAEDRSHQASSNSSGVQTIGGLLLVAGLAIAAYFFLGFDASVESGSGRVMNLGLMADRQNGIIIGIGLGVVGAIMLVIGLRGKN